MRFYTWVILMSVCLVGFASADDRLSVMPDSPESEQEMTQEQKDVALDDIRSFVAQNKPLMAWDIAKEKMVVKSSDFRGVRYLVEQGLEHNVVFDPRHSGDHPDNTHWGFVCAESLLILGRSPLKSDQELFIDLVKNSTTLFLGLDCYDDVFMYSNLDSIALMQPPCRKVATERAMNDWKLLQKKEATEDLAQYLYWGSLHTGRTPAEELKLFFGSKIQLPTPPPQ